MLSALSLSRRRKSLLLSGLGTSLEAADLKRVRFAVPSENDDSESQCSLSSSNVKVTCGNERAESDESAPLMLPQHENETAAATNETHENRLRSSVELAMGVAAALSRAGHILRSRQHKAEEEDVMNSIVPSVDPTVEKASALAHGTNKSRTRRRRCCNPCNTQKIVRFLLEDWLFLAILGVLMAFLSLAVDACIDQLQMFHMYLMSKVERADDDLLNFALTYIVWMVYTMVVMLTSVVFVHYVGPQAIGSGIPEMKTILRGVRLKECLSFRTLLAKMVGLALAIGSGFPIGKEGPFVHVGSIVANLISRLVRNFKPAYANESRSCEMLAAGCAAGVACTFSAPIGGVLFSIEVTAVYFAVRDYWRGFFAAACGSAIFSLLRLYTHSSEVTVVAFYQTTFKNRAFYPEELFIFALMGLFCGITGAIFIWIHRQLVLFLRRNSFMKIIFQRNWIVYPIVICAFYATLTHPIGFGRYITGEVVFSRTLKDFFMNCTWSADPSRFEACGGSVAARWSADESIFAELTAFVVGFYFLSIVASTLPVPAGIFMPVFVIGAGMGRLFGEIVAHHFPDGLRGDRHMLVYPGIYAVVGASSFCGAVTHTVSVAVIAFELTGQLLHILPVMIAVIIANITCSSFQSSFFDSIIKIKHLPYLPDIPKSTSEVHTIRAEQIMVTNVMFLSKKSTYRELQDLLICMPRLRAFPVVDDPESRILLGSVSRATLLQLLDAQVGEATRRAEAAKRAKVEREQMTAAQVSRKKPLFSIGTPEASRKSAVENFLATYAKPSAADRFRILPVFFHDRHDAVVVNGGREANADSTRTRRPLGRSISETNERKVHTTSLARKGSEFKTVSSMADMQSDSAELYHHKKLFTVHSAHELYATLGGMLRSFTHTFHRHSKKRRSNSDLMGKERRDWERKQLACIVDFESAAIDPAPFQLVEDTSLYKVHSIFSLLGIRRAYVTKCGVLVGVVALRDLRSAIERTQWGELNSKTERSDQDAEQTIATNDRRSSCHSDIHQTDLDSDTDDEDCILPRVEIEEATPSTCELEQRLPMARTSSDISDQYITDEIGQDEPGTHLPSKLESYLEAFGEKPARQNRRASILAHLFLSHKIPGPGTAKSTRHVLIVEPKEGCAQKTSANEEAGGCVEDISRISDSTAAPIRCQDSCGSVHHKYEDVSEIASEGSISHMAISVGTAADSSSIQPEDTRQEHIAEKCSVWIDDDDEAFIYPSRPVQASDEESAPIASTSGQQPVPTSFCLTHENGQSTDEHDSVFTDRSVQRSVSDVIPPRIVYNMPIERRTGPVLIVTNTMYRTPSSSIVEGSTRTGQSPTDDDL